MEKKRSLFSFLILIIVLVCAYLIYDILTDRVTADSIGTAQEQTQDEELALAPDFTVQDVDGNEVSLSSQFGKPIVLNFWASWCGPCKSEMPDFEEKYQEYGDTIQFLMVNLTDNSQETVETASGFIAGQGYTFPVFYDTDYSAAQAYGVYSIPVTYFIDERGDLITYGQGALSASSLQKGIDILLGGEA